VTTIDNNLNQEIERAFARALGFGDLSLTRSSPMSASVKRKGKRAEAPKTNPANRVKQNNPDEFDVKAALTQLEEANEGHDRNLAKKLRRQLRAHGHRGGLRMA
jgi:hypothetical protein